MPRKYQYPNTLWLRAFSTIRQMDNVEWSRSRDHTSHMNPLTEEEFAKRKKKRKIAKKNRKRK